jgi:hypothetical protein
MIYDVHVTRGREGWVVTVEGLLRPWSRHPDHDEAMASARSRSSWYGSRLIDHVPPGEEQDIDSDG